VIDGGLFTFVVSNDPEFFLLVEAVAGGKGEPRWQYSLARMSSQKHTVQLDDKEIWAVTNYYTDPAENRKTGPYVESGIGRYLPGDAPKTN
jgi:hypothetical protein